jgi:hypothetical protein
VLSAVQASGREWQGTLKQAAAYRCCCTTSPASESVIVSPDGRATMLSKFGGVYEAVEQPDGSFALNTTARAWLGPGRPLGAGFDARGDLYVCDALKVGTVLGACCAVPLWFPCCACAEPSTDGVMPRNAPAPPLRA